MALTYSFLNQSDAKEVGPEAMKNYIKMNDLIKIDSLPSKYGSTYESLQGGLICGIASGITVKLAEIINTPALLWIALILSVISAICWFKFYNRFSEACHNLKYGEKNTIKTIAYTCLIGGLLGAAGCVAGKLGNIISVIAIAGIVNAIVNIIFFAKMGIDLKKHYCGTLGEIGHGIIKALKLLIGLIVIAVAGTVLLISTMNTALAIIIALVIASFSIYCLIFTYTSVWDRMVDVIEAGFFENKD